MSPTTIGPGQSSAIRRAVPADAPALTALGRRTFEATFAEGNEPDDLAAYIEGAFQVPLQHAEITDPDVVTVVVESGGSLIGYAQVRRLDAPTDVTGPDPVQLRRLYVDAQHHGRGLGKQLMDAAYSAARELGGRTLWLTVWERNQRAMAFYDRCGFRIVGATAFIVGEDVQTDHVMAIAIPDA